MNYLKSLFLVVGLLVSLCGFSQKVAVIKLPELEKLMTQPNDTTYVINFWATWCAPCVKELPHFEQVNATYARQKVKVILVSMDFASQVETKVKPFVNQRNLKSKVVVLNEPDYNSWIDKVDATWSGAIPFTLLVNNQQKRRKGFEKEFTFAELTTAIDAFLK